MLKRGDVIRLTRDEKGEWELTQIPAVQAALISLDPEDGSVRALVGGFSFLRSKFNRAVMAARQPGSSFKPFLYSAAFERGFTPASIVNDAPVVFPDPSRPDGMWTPSNDDDKFDGPMRLREALVQSKNLVSVRLLDAIGVRFVRDYVIPLRLLTPDSLPQNLSLALGTASVSPMSMARGYAVFANGGFLVTPYFITEIDDRDGKPVYKANPPRACRDLPGATARHHPARSAATVDAAGQDGDARQPPVPPRQPAASATPCCPTDAHDDGQPPKLAPQVIDVRNDYLVTSLMQDVIKRGTGFAAKDLGRDDLAGKTGSTNDHRDAWFVGFNGHLVAAVWVGFDDFTSLGKGEFGAKAALPIWMDYMGTVLKDQPSAHPADAARHRHRTDRSVVGPAVARWYE